EHQSAFLGTVNLSSGSANLTNRMLADLFKKCLMGPAGQSQYRDYALDLALAIRMLQIDAPVVVLEIGSFDFHSAEQAQASELYSFVGRAWAALRWLLAKIPDPGGGGSLFDHTLCFSMSDFGRDSPGPTGWNGGYGTDHGSDYACYYLAHPVMGANI